MACLIFGGVMDRFPELKFYLSHVGGFVPWIRGRWQHGYGERREPKVHGAKDPEQYFGRFYYDTIIHNAIASSSRRRRSGGADSLRHGLSGGHGLSPARAGYSGPERLSEAEQEMILTTNARRVYGLAK